MAESRGRRARDAAIGVVGVVAFGAGAGATPARADDVPYPSWSEVQQAKQDTAAASAAAAKITGLLGDLQDRADAAGRTAQIAAERAHQAQAAEQAAKAEHDRLAASAATALTAAKTAKMRAGLLAAGLARSAGGGAVAQLLLDEQGAGDLLGRLASADQLSAQTRTIYDDAIRTARQAQALGDQAQAAEAVLGQRSAAAAAALATAQQAATAAEAAVTTEEQHQQVLLAQLADLRGTSTRLAAQYVAGVQAARDAQAAARERAAEHAQPTPVPSATGDDPQPTDAPSPAAPSTAPSASTDPTPQQAGVTTQQPNSAQAASAVAFARDQIGDVYAYGGAGPSTWDCSGLTMQAYASIGMAIGGHSATAQYRLAQAQGQLVPYAQVQVGDLIFYTDGGGDMYHVAIYSGAGLMIEAPYPGAKVREVPVRAVDRVGYVARPTA